MRIFRSDDGAELREEDVLRVISTYVHRSSEWGDPDERHDAACRIHAALAPKTCGATLKIGTFGTPTMPLVFKCVLPPEHHPFIAEGSGGSWPSRTCLTCDNLPANPLHSPGHMTAPKCWHESMPAGGSFRVSLETEVNTKP